MKNFLPLQAGDVPATYADVADLMRDTGFKPATPIETGIARFVEWYREYYKVWSTAGCCEPRPSSTILPRHGPSDGSPRTVLSCRLPVIVGGLPSDRILSLFCSCDLLRRDGWSRVTIMKPRRCSTAVMLWALSVGDWCMPVWRPHGPRLPVSDAPAWTELRAQTSGAGAQVSSRVISGRICFARRPR